jgi:hypothetical protein
LHSCNSSSLTRSRCLLEGIIVDHHAGQSTLLFPGGQAAYNVT